MKQKRYRDLSEFFEKTGMTQGWLADQLDIDRSYVSLICGRKRQPSLGLSLRIAELTGVPVEAFVTGDEVSA